MTDILQSIGLGTLDAIVLGVLFLGSAMYTFMVSRGRILPIIVSTYMAYVLVDFAPFLEGLANMFGFTDPFLIKIVLFIVLFLAVLFILFGIVFQTPVGSEIFGLWAAFLMSFLQVGFLIAVFFSFLPEHIIAELSGTIKLIFVNQTALFIWAAAPVAFLLYVGTKVNSRISGVDDDYYEQYEDDEDYEE